MSDPELRTPSHGHGLIAPISPETAREKQIASRKAMAANRKARVDEKSAAAVKLRKLDRRRR